MNQQDFRFSANHYRPEPPRDHFNSDMSRQQREWERDFDRMRDDFFRSSFIPDNSFDTFPSTIRRKVYTNSSPVREYYTTRSEPSPVREVYTTRSEPSPQRHQQPFKVTLDLDQFEPEDIKVTLKDHLLTVNAAHELIQDGSKRIKQYSESVQIPRSVDPDNIMSIFTDDGKLTIEAPVPPSYQQVIMERQERQ